MRWLPTKREMLLVSGTELVVWESWKGQDNHGLDLCKIATEILSLLVFLWVSQSRVKVGSYILYRFIVNVPVLHHCDPLCIKVRVYLLVKPNVYWPEAICACDLIESQNIPAGLITESLRKILLTNPDNIVPEALPLAAAKYGCTYRNPLCFSFRQKLPDKATLPNVTVGTSAQRAVEQD